MKPVGQGGGVQQEAGVSWAGADRHHAPWELAPPCPILLRALAPSLLLGSGAQPAGAAAPGSCAQPIQGFRNLSNSPHSRNGYDTNLNFHLICSCRLPDLPSRGAGRGTLHHLAG